MFDTTLDAAAIRALLPAGTRFTTVDAVASTGSTNADLAAAARDGAAPGRVLLAAEQTAGRGRLARRWESPAGACIAMSVLVEPHQPAERWGWLSLLTGLAVAETLEALAPDGVEVTLKWPNDVLVDGRKVCGILSERIERHGGDVAVIGMGINLTLTRDQLPVPNATSLALAGFDTDAAAVAAGILTHLDRHLGMFDDEGTVRDAYRPRCASIGAELTITPTGRQPIPGTGHDVDADGCLQVRTARGIETYAVGDVVHARLA